jgi:putative effector of murein hydrolase
VTWLALTLLAYAAGLLVQGRTRTPLANPTLIACLTLVPLLLLSRTTYETYSGEARPLSVLLTPAVVALAVPLYRQRAFIRRAWRAVLLGGVVGTLIAVTLNTLGGQLIAAPREVRLALSTDSVTSPVAYAISERLLGAPPLAAAFVIIVGLIGATVLPGLLTRVGVRSKLARGLALGAVAHGIGTARAREEGELSGAAASVGMCLGALVVTLVSAFL